MKTMYERPEPEEEEKKPWTAKKKKRRELRQDWNNKGPCPTRKCKHPPVDHRPIAHTDRHYCYNCMNVCA